jgi:hypothetical protein
MSHQVATSFPDQNYSLANKPQSATLKSDLQLLEDAHNAHDADTTIHQTISKASTAEVTTGTDDVKYTTSAGVAAAITAAITAVKTALFPVGSYYANGAVSTNPATLLGFGTWVAVAGKAIVGLDGTQTEFDTLLKTGGAKTHTLLEAEMPSHTHTFTARQSGSPDQSPTSAGRFLTAASSTTDATGGGGAHNNLQPFEVAALWRRTA